MPFTYTFTNGVVMTGWDPAILQTQVVAYVVLHSLYTLPLYDFLLRCSLLTSLLVSARLRTVPAGVIDISPALHRTLAAARKSFGTSETLLPSLVANEPFQKEAMAP